MPESDNLEALYRQAREHVRNRAFSEAIRCYEEALAEDETDGRAHEGLATVAFLTGDLERAATHFRRLAQLAPRRADPLVNLGAVQNRQGEYAEAIKTLQQALSRDRKCAEAYYNLGIAQKGRNQLSMAVSAYREAIRLNPGMAEAFQNLANLYVEMGNYQQASLNFRRALEIRPDFDKARRGLQAAQARAEMAAREINPPGRLVDVAKLRSPVDDVETTQPLTFEERQADREEVLELLERFAESSEQLLEELHAGLTPALLRMSHALLQTSAPGVMHEAHEALYESLVSYRGLCRSLMQTADALASHEDSLRRRG